MTSPTSPTLSFSGVSPSPVQVENSPNISAPMAPASAPEAQISNATAFWNAFVAGAGAFSAAVATAGATWGKGRITATSSVADTFTAQVSYDGTTWYDLTQDNAGTLWTLATVAGHLSAARDLPGPIPPNLRLVSVGAATVTAGYQFFGL